MSSICIISLHIFVKDDESCIFEVHFNLSRSIVKYIGYIIITILMGIGLSCANYGNLTGGPKDETPPQLIEEKSTPFNQIQFRPTEINLTFDEWIRLKDQHKQILISPPLKKPASYTVKGKTLNIKFDKEEVLRDSTTYVMQFGSSIIDITESNAASNLKFVFSTGDVIDSLEFGGIVIDAWTKKPVENVTVMLYDKLVDSLPYTVKPNFVVRTNSSGQFVLQNLRADSFKLFVLEDNNLNYLYDQDNERIAFHSEPIFTMDSIQDLTLMLFEKMIPNRVASKTIWHNAIRVFFQKKPEAITYHFMDSLSSFHTWHQDSLYVWLENKIEKNNKLIFKDDKGMLDTLDIEVDKIRKSYKSGIKIFNDLTFQQLSSKTWALRTNQPVDLMIDSLILMDSVIISIDSYEIKQDTNPEIWFISHPWNSNISYKLVAPPGSLKGFDGKLNLDSIFIDLRIKKREQHGNIIVHLRKADSTTRKLILRLEKGDELVVKKNVFVSDSSTQVLFEKLPAASYQLRIIYDKNNNGYWDPGSYDDQLQPEETQIEAMQALRANWDLDVKILLNSLNSSVQKSDLKENKE